MEKFLSRYPWFFSVYQELPSDVGYEMFSKPHLISLGACAALIAALVLFYYIAGDEIRFNTLRIIAVLLPTLELLKDVFLVMREAWSIAFLPLHVCSMCLPVFLLVAFLHEGRLRTILSEISLTVLMPAAVFALLTPDWTAFPLMNLLSIHSYVWHALQIAFPLMLLIDGVWPRLRHWFLGPLFLLICGIPVWFFDRASGMNYFFLRNPIPGTPLETIYGLFGQKGYIPALTVLSVVVAVFVSILYENIYAFRRRP